MSTIEQAHKCYCDLTGLVINLRVHERVISDFLEHGFTVEDLELVLRHLKRENARMSGAAYSLRIDKLLDFEYRRFDSLLSEARAHKRNRVVRTPADRVMAQFRGHDETTTGSTPQAVRAVLRQMITPGSDDTNQPETNGPVGSATTGPGR
jgi:hypothetical protein